MNEFKPTAFDVFHLFALLLGGGMLMTSLLGRSSLFAGGALIMLGALGVGVVLLLAGSVTWFFSGSTILVGLGMLLSPHREFVHQELVVFPPGAAVLIPGYALVLLGGLSLVVCLRNRWFSYR
ncbi:hypothetical protein COCCU_06050 [Corynebacterium occultum]|uniref:Uncharacterized protein n=1 Tax=Corynebacterium occultum TaxID=2675219 RepID=A0A6B8W0V3_9CORY|nr:hypothetical protein [Corynebacterium occultum]QGU07154.1 hypothetical protein COCCU_06050 [Corynebacterium occultum]